MVAMMSFAMVVAVRVVMTFAAASVYTCFKRICHIFF
jgi:hypothetical protein